MLYSLVQTSKANVSTAKNASGRRQEENLQHSGIMEDFLEEVLLEPGVSVRRIWIQSRTILRPENK